MTVSPSPLFSPLKVGTSALQHRVAMAPLTRRRAVNHVPTDLNAHYYKERSSRPGTLIITEATFIALKAGGLAGAPGIWSEEQIRGWKKIFDNIHENKSFAYVQLWALGNRGYAQDLEADGVHNYFVSASDVKSRDDTPTPRPLSREEIKEYVQLYVQAAKNSIQAGADGVELHSANGYLPDQFLHENTNHRTDEYGGSIENRARFTLEIIDALIEAIGAEKVGVRFSPWNQYGPTSYSVTPIPQWSYVIAELEKRARDGNRLAFIHVVEPRVAGQLDVKGHHGTNEFIRNIWGGILIRAGGLVEDAEKFAKEDPNVVIAVGRYFISNPDLVDRIENKIELVPYDRSTFYAHEAKTLEETIRGYTDYPFANKTK